MKFTAATIALACSVAIVPSFAAADPVGPYIMGSLGLSQLGDIDLEGTGINTSMESDLGYAIAGAIGYNYANAWRAEGELSFRRSDVDTIGSSAGRGDTSAFGVMVSGYYDFATESAWTPYLGAGVGVASVSYDGVSPVGGSRIDDSDWGFAYQGIAGVSYQMNEEASLFSEYRYVGTTGVDLSTDSGVGVDGDGGEHRIMIGLRWSFGKPKPAPKAVVPVQAPAPVVQPKVQPAPPPAPEPEPEPVPDLARNYLVFFDWDRSDITPDVTSILQLAVSNSREMGVTRIEAVGHADRSGTNSYNMGLSQRRAAAVQSELIRLGIPASEISIQWRGEEEPLVQTADGVREPQNRRVEIILN